MSVHQIRLIGPWDYVWHGLPDALPFQAKGSTKMPCSWQTLFGSLSGGAAFSRQFHKPTNLEPQEQVVIVLTRVRGQGTVSLNGRLLTAFASDVDQIETEVTEHLERFNLLEVQIHVSPNVVPAGLHEPVVLEIRTPNNG